MSFSPMIAIIDDDESVRLATASLVRSLGFEARMFASAEDFLGSPQCGATACIITDVQMPGMSGVELQAHLKMRSDRTPVIFITAFPEERIHRQVVGDGAIGFLAKPLDGDELASCIDRALERGTGSTAG